ncbi:sperm-tail PG-rich repeat-containing protein 2-like [Xenia sp. Carnegie-2017]|uniref:sperm-tail PG-rich repeat-containing protein 2-like n=1 Tax=Xenia sp. Carnegie-2017 TaxID=2897299 RepID=UPI001F03454D|nr:sperm-tail PG-rich repeat-containing protein 2-like [Xenia sp. Carnegie-2017]
MYDRASRNLSQPLAMTEVSVGPGSYELASFLKGKVKNSVGYAPFGSMTSRETFVDVPDQTIAAPGPGQYDLKLRNANHIVGGQSLSNTSKRFEDLTEAIPGPGTYNLSKHSDWIKQLPQKQLYEEESEPRRRIILLRKTDPPSIPSPGKSYGYEEATDGSLKPQVMPERDESMGPAYYNVDHRETQTTRNYKGVFFGGKDSKRLSFKGSNQVPGPGAYDPYEPPENKMPIDLIIEEQQKRFYEAKIPRYHELVPKDEERKGVPAPGHYEIKSQFENLRQDPEFDITALVAPFGSQSKRFEGRTKTCPAPGSYDDPRTAFETLKRVKGVKSSPFGQTSIRFCDNKCSKSIPGPGSYNVPDQVSDVIKKNLMVKKKNVAFGSSSMRTFPITRTRKDSSPGPAHYINMDNKVVNNVGQLSSTFASITNRLLSPPPIVKDIPPPGSYEVRQSYDKTQGRVLYPGSQKTSRNSKKKGGFLSSTSRFKNGIHTTYSALSPGPGKYDVPTTQTKQGGLMVTKDTRFKFKKSEVPGPGKYQLSPQIAHSVLKGTFNATLNNPLSKSKHHDLNEKSSNRQNDILLT